MSTQEARRPAKKLGELVEYYEQCNRAEGRSPKTISWYSANLKRFHRYLKSRHLPDSIDRIDTRLLREYVLHLLAAKKYENHPTRPVMTEPLSSASIHGHVRTLRAFFGWLVREDLIETNVALNVKPPKVVTKVIPTLSDQEIAAILGALNATNPGDARDQTIFMVLFDTGLRIGELVGLKMVDVHINEGFLKVLGKGKKERLVPIGSNAQRALQRYIFRFRSKPANPGIDNVFLSTGGNAMTENGAGQMFARLAERSGVHRLHAHLCRHTFATRFLINGGDVFTLQQILGHSTLEMVRTYVNLASSHVAIQHRRFSPLDHLDLRRVKTVQTLTGQRIG
ncbi:MAG: tyrosine-type recombinase/integrase [Dehalococcoidia bacterium]|nr:tyrosine-type recombinase/integrase [Dehalococcoidia bacterium]